MPTWREVYPAGPTDSLDGSSHNLRRILGVLGIALPLLCMLAAELFPTTIVIDGREVPLPPPGSVSGYYYTSGVSAFVGILVGMGLFLFTYKGYNDDYARWDSRVSTLVGIAALGVAVFPTDPPDPSLGQSWWDPWMGTVHNCSAFFLFGLFLVFCWWLFPGKDWRLTADQRRERNIRSLVLRERIRKYPFFYLCGAGIVICLGWAGIAMLMHASIFLPEWGALWFFGLAWLRAGQLDKTIYDSIITKRIVARLSGGRT